MDRLELGLALLALVFVLALATNKYGEETAVRVITAHGISVAMDQCASNNGIAQVEVMLVDNRNTKLVTKCTNGATFEDVLNAKGEVK